MYYFCLSWRRNKIKISVLQLRLLVFLLPLKSEGGSSYSKALSTIRQVFYPSLSRKVFGKTKRAVYCRIKSSSTIAIRHQYPVHKKIKYALERMKIENEYECTFRLILLEDEVQSFSLCCGLFAHQKQKSLLTESSW